MHKIKAEGNRAPLIQKSVFTFYISLKGNRLNFLVKRYRLGKWNLKINRYMLPRESEKTSVIWQSNKVIISRIKKNLEKEFING